MDWFATSQVCKAGVWPGWCVEVSSLHLYKTILLCSCNWHWKPYCPLLTIPTLGTNSTPSFKPSLQWLNKTILEFPWAIPKYLICCIWANQSQESASEEHLPRKHLPECCICESWVCTFLSKGFHAFYSSCPFSRTGRWSLAEMIEGYFRKSSVYWQWLIPLLEVKRTLLRLDHCTGDLKVHLTKIPCKTNGTLLLLTLERVKPRCLTRLLFYNVVGSFQSWWFPAGILLRMDHESVLYRDILGFHQRWRLEEDTRCLSIIRDNIFSSWEPSLCNQDFFFWSCSMLLERVLGRILYSVLIC